MLHQTPSAKGIKLLLKNWFQLIAHYWWQTLLVAAVVGIFAASVLRLLTPPPVSVAPDSPITTSSIRNDIGWSNILFTGPQPSFPTELSPLTNIEIGQASQTIFQRVLDQYELTVDSDNPLFWSGPAATLSLDPSTQTYQLTLASADGSTINLDQARTVAQDFLNQFSFANQLSLTDTQFFTGSFELVSSASVDNASVVNFTFQPVFNGVPITSGNSNFSGVQVLVGGNNELLKITWTDFVSKSTALPSQELLSVNRAISNINQNQATLVSFSTTSFNNLSLNQVTSGQMRRVNLEYRYDPTTGLAYPFYRFSGVVESQSGSEFEVEVITPAL